MSNELKTAKRLDWARRPSSVMLWWGIPVAIVAVAGMLRLPLSIHASICAASLIWMAAGCLLNARRCRRLHCFVSGPVLLLGGITAALVAAGALSLGPQAFHNAVSATLLLAVLSFVPEFLWKRYV